MKKATKKLRKQKIFEGKDNCRKSFLAVIQKINHTYAKFRNSSLKKFFFRCKRWFFGNIKRKKDWF